MIISKLLNRSDNVNIPNLLTIFRLILIPVFILVFFSEYPGSLLNSTMVFLIAGFTDSLDGYIARKYKLITKIGIVLDPLADKLMLLTVLTCLSLKGYIPSWVLIVVAVKEILMILCGIFLYKKGTVIPSNIFGKLSTIFFYISIFIFSFYKTIGIYLLYFSVGSAIIALLNYTVVFLKKEKR